MAQSKMFASELCAFRKYAGLTLRETAAMVGRHWNTVARWERGERIPDPLVQEAVLARLKLYSPQRASSCERKANT